MPSPTYVPLATLTVTSATQTALEFTSIPQGYTDLLIKASTRASNNTINFELTFNNSATGYEQITLYADGSAATGQVLTSQAVLYGYAQVQSTYTASVFSNAEIYIPNYAGSTNKSISIDEVNENNATQAYQSMVAGRWANTAAITSIKIAGYGASLVQHSSATLYGISKS